MDLKSILGPSPEDASNPSASKSQPPPPAILTRHSSHPAPQLPRQQQQQPPPPPPPLVEQQRPSTVPRAFTQRTHSGPIVPQTSSRQNASPLSQASIPSVLPAHVLSPLVQGASSPLISPVPGGAITPQGGQRTPSTPSMDTLADLASMQTHQPMRPPLFKAGSLESNISADSARFSAIADATLTSNPRASFDINMLETAKSNVRTDFSHSSLPETQRKLLNELAVSLQHHPSAYQYHVELINILHQGFTNHVYPSASPDSRRDPATYDLLPELRAARDAMEKLFVVGEALWLDWLQDESLLARSADERIAVVEKCRRAVDDEVGSVKLWSVYGDWVLHCYNWANSPQTDDTVDEEKLVGQEIFNSQLVLDVLHQAVDATANDLHSSHIVWNKYLNFRIPDNQQRLDTEQASLCLQLFERRLTQPHAQWDDTFQMFSTFVSTNMPPDQYESVMMETNKAASAAKKIWADREVYELALESAQQDGDRDAEYNNFIKYLDWELTPEKKRRVNLDLCNALYQRAELRFPSEASIWEDHVACMLETSIQSLGLLDRATKHCPWSGSLWSQYLLASDRLGHSFQDTERIKHRATSTGVLEAAGIEEVLKVHAAWCSYLRRRAFQADRDEDDADIAEIGIRASLESISSLGAKLGIGEAPDSSFRLQRIYINFLTKCGRWDNARHELDNAMRDYGKSYDFWSYFYRWEMMRWRRFEPKADGSESLNANSPPHLATAVLKQALDQPNLDYPEPIIELFISHCEDHENADELQSALLKVRKVQKALVARRQIEAVQAAQANAVYKHDQHGAAVSRHDFALNKRKREDDFDDESKSDVNKRNKNGDFAVETVEETPAEQPKRDREHATVLVENLPEHITEVRIRQYFSSCGTVKAIKLLDDSNSAIVEFDTDDEAHYALSRDAQQLDEAIISVTLDTGSTVFLTNYKPEADEAYLRDLLDPFGHIISVRLPSLQGNKRRRFCYVQFRLPSEAQDAVNTLDGRKIDDLPLSCKISNPGVKQARHEVNVNDGSTVFVGGIHFSAKEEEVEAAFADCGEIVRIRMPLHEKMKNRNKGIAFVTFSSTESAEKALQMDGQKIKGRPVNIKIATKERTKGSRHGSEITHDRRSITPVERHDAQNGHVTSASLVESVDPSTRNQRTIFLTNVADTVNEARLRSIGSQYGTVVKAVLKTTHQGALIEYATLAAAGDAALKLDGQELTLGRPVRVVSEAEMKKQGPEKKALGFQTTTATKTAASGMAFIKRPIQPGSRPRKGGNLGQKSAFLHSSKDSRDLTEAEDAAKAEQDEKISADVENTTGKKNNDDFRALLAGKKG